jgi:hydrogenase maturation protein HypF
VNYEAQAAIEFEMAAHDSTDEGAYTFDLIADGPHWQIGTRSVFENLLCDLAAEESVGNISQRFHRGLADLFVELAENIREQNQLNRVCLSGGCFQNALFFQLLLDGLRAKAFEVYFHTEVPAGDGGISLGQALVAAHRVRATQS